MSWLSTGQQVTPLTQLTTGQQVTPLTQQVTLPNDAKLLNYFTNNDVAKLGIFMANYIKSKKIHDEYIDFFSNENTANVHARYTKTVLISGRNAIVKKSRSNNYRDIFYRLSYEKINRLENDYKNLTNNIKNIKPYICNDFADIIIKMDNTLIKLREFIDMVISRVDASMIQELEEDFLKELENTIELFNDYLK
jgi:hypothetical protein